MFETMVTTFFTLLAGWLFMRAMTYIAVTILEKRDTKVGRDED